MKIRISELMDGDCCLRDAELDGVDDAILRRIEKRTMEKIELCEKTKMRKPVRILLLAAALTVLLGTAAFAVSEFAIRAQNRTDADPPMPVRWLMISESGEVLMDVKDVVSGPGVVLSFTGPEETRRLPEFRCFYLPSEPNFGWTDKEGWTRYLTDERGKDMTGLPYIIEAQCVEPGVTRLVIHGEAQLVQETRWGDWQVLEYHSDYRNIRPWSYEEANFVLLFDQVRGYLVQVKGTLELEELEHIAREMEIRESEELFQPSGFSEMLASIDPARG